MDTANAHLINRLLDLETHTMLQYLRGAGPWTGAAYADLVGALEKLAAEEEQGARALADFLRKQHVVPRLTGFPEPYSTLHFLALDHLIPRLISFQKELLRKEEDLVGRLTLAEAKAVAMPVLERKARHLTDLEKLNTRFGGKVVSTLR
jgi:hypothetical protein